MASSSASGGELAELKQKLRGLEEQKAVELRREKGTRDLEVLGELNKDLDRVQAAITALSSGIAPAILTHSITDVSGVRSLLNEIMQSQSFREFKLQQESSVCMPFQGRKKMMTFVWERIMLQYTRLIKSPTLSGQDLRRQMEILVCQGGSGTGKSRFVQQLVEDISSKLPLESRASPQILPKAGVGISLDLNNGDRYLDHKDGLLPVESSLAVRMIAHGILGLSVEDLRAYPAWNKVNEAGVNTAMATTLLAEQVRQDAALPRDEYVLVLLCCDEYQELLHARDSKGNPVAEKWTRAVASWAIKACSSQRVVARGLYCGLSVPASTFKLTQVGAAYMYLTLLSPAEAVQALQQSLEATQVYSSGRLQRLLKSSQLRTQLAVAFGLPLLVEFLRQALLDDEVCIGLNSKINSQQRLRAAASLISYQVLQSIQRWLVPQGKVPQIGVYASFDLLRLYLSGVPVIADTPLGAGSHGARTVAAAAEIGVVWAASYVHPISGPAGADTSQSSVSESSESQHVFSLQSPPQLIKLLMDQLQLPRNDQLDHNQLNLLGYISDAFPYPFAEAMYGETFQDLMLVCQVCRHSLIAEGKCALRTTLRVDNMWPSAVAAPAVLSDKVVIEPLQITTDVVKRVTGSSGAPTFAVAPHEDWLGEGYATRMDTSAGNTTSVDWRFVLKLSSGQLLAFFVQNKFVSGPLSAKDVMRRFEALRADFVRVCPKVHFRMVYMTSSTIPTSLKEYATTDPKGKGLILLDAAAVAELCPMIRSAGYMYADPSQLISQSQDALQLLDLPSTPSRRKKQFPKRQGINAQACKFNPVSNLFSTHQLRHAKLQQRLQLTRSINRPLMMSNRRLLG